MNQQYEAGAAFLDGRFTPISEAKISLLDLGFSRSDATYDVVHVWRGAFFRLDDHLDRFERSCARWHFDVQVDRQALVEILVKCVKLTGLRDAYVEMGVTRGDLVPGTRDPRACTNRLFVYAIPFVWILPFERRFDGLTLSVSNVVRIPPSAVDPTVKNYHWADLTMGLFQAYDEGADTTILVDLEGNLTEGPGFNIFVVKAGHITSPSGTVFEGITRRTVDEICQSLGVTLKFGTVTVGELLAADEVFITSTAGGIMPISKVRGKAVGAGQAGPITRALIDKYWQWHEDSKYATRINY